MDFIELRQKYKALRYDSYHCDWQADGPSFRFLYSLIGVDGNTIRFEHKLSYQLWQKGKLVSLTKSKADQFDLENFIFQIGLAETINYWKLACPAQLVIACGWLTKDQVAFWKKLYYNGLGEFIYLNGIHRLEPAVSLENLVDIVSLGQSRLPLVQARALTGTLIPVGGGKDSVVSLELLKVEADKNLPFVMSPPQAAYDCIAVAGYDRYLLASRQLDPKIVAMNQAGFLNGHVPFSAILAFIAALGAALTGKRYIALSNEKSANEPSVVGTTFNHQYSKTLEFEKDFTAYFQRYVMDQIEYFSLLRPLYEIDIAQAFASYEAYHPVFRSCNRGKKTNSWCGQCSKCLFVYIMLSPYIAKDKLQAIFGKDLLDDPDLSPILWELIGLADNKPFECVGTIWEVVYALDQTVGNYHYQPDGPDTPALIKAFLGAALPPSQPDQNYEAGDCIPAHFKHLLPGHQGKER